jgi:hypothetical protein
MLEANVCLGEAAFSFSGETAIGGATGFVGPPVGDPLLATHSSSSSAHGRDRRTIQKDILPKMSPRRFRSDLSGCLVVASSKLSTSAAESFVIGIPSFLASSSESTRGSGRAAPEEGFCCFWVDNSAASLPD